MWEKLTSSLNLCMEFVHAQVLFMPYSLEGRVGWSPTNGPSSQQDVAHDKQLPCGFFFILSCWSKMPSNALTNALYTYSGPA